MWNPLKQFLWQWRGVWITTPTIATLIIALRFIGLLQSWEWEAFDFYMRLRPLEPPDQRIAIVGIDETDLQLMGQSIISDAVYAQLIKKLKTMQPRAIGLDIYRNLPVEPGHQELMQVFESTPNLVGIQKVVGDADREAVLPPPKLQLVGANDLIFDADKKVRRSLIYVGNSKGENILSFSTYLALLYLEAEGIKPTKVPGSMNLKFGEAVLKRFSKNDGSYVQADNGGYQLLLNYRGPNHYFEIVPLRDILADKVPPNWGRDRIILIGTVAESLNDVFFTPHSGGLLSIPERMTGVEVHANITSQIISAALDNRPLIQGWTEPLEWFWIFVWSGVGAILTWQLRYVGGVTEFSWQRLASPFLAAGALLASTYLAFLWGWWIPVIPPFLALIGSGISVGGYLAYNAGEIRKTFGRYLNEDVVANLLENPEGLKLGGERRTITILTSDLRGFTALSERLPPEEVVKILNIYLGYMTDVIISYQGTIDSFIGDGILVLFGAPTSREDDAERAVACAIAMQLAMEAVNHTLKEMTFCVNVDQEGTSGTSVLAEIELAMGIGINTGVAVVGNIGSEKRTNYSVIGNEVNLAFRIETYTLGGEILISESTFQEVKKIVQIKEDRQVKPKGLKNKITIYEVAGIGGKHNLFLPKVEEIFYPLIPGIPIQYTLLDGKQVSDQFMTAKLIKLSSKGAVIQVEFPENNGVPEPSSNIQLSLFDGEHTHSVHSAYAKVLDKPTEPGSFYIAFTMKSPEIAVKLKAIYQALCESEKNL